jgi:RNA polymerase sigma-70 factor (ECF subfamily)
MHDAADDALLAAMAAGDGDAAVAFVRRFQARVFGVAHAVLGDRDRADDVAQEAFMRAWRHGDSFDARRGSVVSWLLAITRNLAIDNLRAQRIRPTEQIEAVIAQVAARDPDPLSAAVLDDDRRRVVVALQDVPHDQKRALLLAALGGRTAQEIGEIENIPLGTAKTRIRTGMRRVRAALEEQTPVNEWDQL